MAVYRYDGTFEGFLTCVIPITIRALQQRSFPGNRNRSASWIRSLY